MGTNIFAQKVVDQMMETDLFSKWPGIEIIEIYEGLGINVNDLKK